MDNYPSKLLEIGVRELAGLPGIGKRTALRLALWMLKQPEQNINAFANALTAMRADIKYCESCHNISDEKECEICKNPARDRSLICVVPDVRDVMAIENTGFYKGVYHVLGGIISPIEGISPSDLSIDLLIQRVSQGLVQEVILALPATMEGDTTIYFIHKKLQDYPVLLSTIARGIAVGDDLEYTDEVTLGRSIINRQPYKS